MNGATSIVWKSLLQGYTDQVHSLMSQVPLDQGPPKESWVSMLPRLRLYSDLGGLVERFPDASPFQSPLEAYLRLERLWSPGLERPYALGKELVEALVDKTPKPVFARGGEHNLVLAYLRMPPEKQKFSVFQKILRRTPVHLLNERDEAGVSPIEFCIQRHLMQNLKALVARGADVHATNEKGQNCLHFLARKWDNKKKRHDEPAVHWQMSKYLLQQGVKIIPDAQGNTPFHLTNRVPLVLFHGVEFDINTRNDEGQTLAMLALGDKPNALRLQHLALFPGTHWPTQLGPWEEFFHHVAPGLDKETLGSFNATYQAQQLEMGLPASTASIKRPRL